MGWFGSNNGIVFNRAGIRVVGLREYRGKRGVTTGEEYDWMGTTCVPVRWDGSGESVNVAKDAVTPQR